MQRLPFVDWARGFAVVAMVLWHTGDGWLRPALKAGEGFYFLRFVGGLAAPSFLLLAGLAAALSARPAPDPAQARRALRASVARGFEVWVFGYALRLQTWVIDAMALRNSSTYRAWLPLLAGYALLVWSARSFASAPRRAAGRALLGVILVAAALAQVEDVAPGRLLRLLQVDVLQAIGASLMLLALLEAGAGLLQRPLWLLALGLLVTGATGPLAALLPGPLPVPLAAYLGRFPPAPGMPNPALFPLFPWFGYALFGAALGACFRLYPRRVEQTVVIALLGGALMSSLSSEAHRFVRQAVNAAPLAVPLLRSAFRSGVVFLLLGIGFAFPRGRLASVLGSFGRASLRIYWIHLLFAYGIFARPMRAALGYGGWAAGASMLLVAMWGLSRLQLPRKAAPVRS